MVVDPEQILSIIRIALFGIIALVAIVYSIPIIFIRRFHHRNNILTLNICIATICCCLYWFIFYLMFEVDPNDTYIFMVNICVFAQLTAAILTLEIPLSFVTVSIHRFCSIVYYNKPLFKTKQWVAICILGQWILGAVFILPILAGVLPDCGSPRWADAYKLTLIVVVPFIVFLITNAVIYISIRSSTHRVHSYDLPSTKANSTPVRPARISRRDVHLLRHMVVILLIFLGGWTPLYALLVTQNQFLINPIEMACFTIWCQLALLCDIIDLYLYNREIRNYLKTICFRCF